MLTERPAPLLQAIMLNSILSFGPHAVPLKLQNLNVLIGPNGSGKSNLIEAIGLLKSTTTDCRPVISRGGGVKEWIWKGKPSDHAAIEVVITNSPGEESVHHRLTFRNANQLFRIFFEQVRVGESVSDHRYEFFESNGASFHGVHGPAFGADLIDPQFSVLAQRRDPANFPEMTRLNPDDLKVWLENYTLGTLWIKGQLGDKRSYVIVGKLNPDALRQLSSFSRVARILNERLAQ